IADRNRIAHPAVHGSYHGITYGVGIWIRILNVWNVRRRLEATISNFQLSWVVVVVGRDPIDSGYDPSILETIRTIGGIGCFYRAKGYAFRDAVGRPPDNTQHMGSVAIAVVVGRTLPSAGLDGALWRLTILSHLIVRDEGASAKLIVVGVHTRAN